jgi:hypothetical protein
LGWNVVSSHQSSKHWEWEPDALPSQKGTGKLTSGVMAKWKVKSEFKSWRVAQVVEHLPSKHEALFKPQYKKKKKKVQEKVSKPGAYNPSYLGGLRPK